MTSERETRGVSQESLARGMGRDQPFLSRLEGADRRVSVIDLVLWSNVIGLTAEQLADGVRGAWRMSGPEARSLWSGPTRNDW